MELKDVLLNRRSVRKFTSKKVGKDIIDELMHAAMSGPSAMNRKPWEFFVVQDPKILEKVIGCMRYANYGANTAIIVAGDITKIISKQVKEFWVQDCSAATENILLRATDLGLGTVWCGAYPDEGVSNALKEVLGAEDNIVPLNVVLVGYPDCEIEPRDQYDEAKVHMIEE